MRATRKLGFKALAALAATSLALAGCLSNGAETLAPNMFRLQLPASGAPNDIDASKALLRAAAQETLARGYQLFRLLEWGSTAPAFNLAGNSEAPRFTIVVKMFRDGEQGSEPVFDARRIAQQ